MRFTKSPPLRVSARLSVLLAPLFLASLLPAQVAAPKAEPSGNYEKSKDAQTEEKQAATRAAIKKQEAEAAASTSEADASVVELSPFQVKSESTGYYASNTTASTRLNSSLNDLATSTTIVTKEMMTDMAMLDINDVFKYEAGTEGTATFTNAEIDRNGSPVDVTSTNPNVANRVRGVGSTNLAIGNYATNGFVPVDPINIDGIEISRGPNSSIFGLGEVSGTVNLQPAMANLMRDRSTVVFRADSYGGYRSSIDLNRVLLKNKLAIRGSGVWQHDGFEREPSGVDSVRLNGMVRYQPFKNTSITGSVSTYRSYGTMDNKTMPRETISSWKAAGSPTWDPVTQTVRVNGAVVPGTWTATNLPPYFQASQSLGLSTVFVQQDGTVSWWGPSRTTASTTTPVGPTQNVFLVSTLYTPTSPAQPLFGSDRATTDQSIYDYTSVNLAGFNRTNVRQSTAMFQLEQTFLNTPRQLLAMQVGYFRENGLRETSDFWGTGGSGGRTGYLYVDVNERMVDGTKNPNFLRPYIGIFTIRERVDTYNRRNIGRAQLAYRLDLRQEKNFLKWVGMHTLSGYAEYRETGRRLTYWQQELANSQAWRPFPTATSTVTGWTNTPLANQPFYRYYVGDADGQNVDYGPHRAVNGLYDFTWGNGLTGVFNRDRAMLDYNYVPNLTYGWTKGILKTRGAALQSFLLKDRLVTTFGYRLDETWDRNAITEQYTYGPDGYKMIESTLDELATAAAVQREGTTKTAGAVLKVTPWLSLTANKSDSFLPSNLAQIGLYRNLLPNPFGKGEDYGLRFSLLKDKLVIRLNRFTTEQLRSRSGVAGNMAQRVAGIDFNTTYGLGGGLSTIARGWVTRAAEAANIVLTEDQINQQISAIVKLDPINWTSPQSNSLTYEPSDVISKGYELELNYNPTRYWTVKFNATQTVAIDKNISSDLFKWIEERHAVWTSIIDPENGLPFWTQRYGGASQSAEQFFLASVQAPLAVAAANEGKSKPQVRKYKANFVTRYNLAGISENKWLRNTTVGGAIRWEAKGAIGYHGVPDAGGIYRSLDAARPIYDKSHTYVDLNASYRTRFWNNKVGTTFQLNINNVMEGGRLQPLSALPDGSIYAYRIVDPRQFILSVTFDL
ncbi:MAG: TonB-dependent receptor plug domain-containing protein [Opitutaceae bacterium]|jgi:hypothetical protein|nr:TonB-dependent receptor plug domain-containing protein [Opitutaceae bacterium]